MRVMVIGSGGREHALAWKISQSRLVSDVICVPGNGGMEEDYECLSADINDFSSLAEIARSRRIDLVVVGPEAPLVEGITDTFRKKGIDVFGPDKKAARMEGSKSFAKQLMIENNIPTGKARMFESYDEARAYIESLEPPVVLKADGLAAGKGVTVAVTKDEALEALEKCMVEKVFGSSGERVLIEEFLEGEEVSILTLSDGKTALHMVPSQDHKRAYDGDEGPNTGGMGAYSPVPSVSEEIEKDIQLRIMEAAIKAMERRGTPYTGVLYGGLILTADGPKVLEFNVRFGDPEAQAVLPRLESDLLQALVMAVEGKLNEHRMRWSPLFCVCVVIASGGYPGKYEIGFPIKGLKAASEDSNVLIFHAGTKKEDGKIFTAGGRVLNIVGLGSDFEEARGVAYEALSMIDFEGMHYRKDIGYRALQALEG